MEKMDLNGWRKKEARVEVGRSVRLEQSPVGVLTRVAVGAWRESF